MINPKGHAPSGAVGPETPRAAVVDIVDADRRLAGTAGLADMVRGALAVVGATGEVRVRVVGDAAMAAAHEKFGGVAGTTDVLTFDLSEGRRRDGAGLDA